MYFLLLSGKTFKHMQMNNLKYSLYHFVRMVKRRRRLDHLIYVFYGKGLVKVDVSMKQWVKDVYRTAIIFFFCLGSSPNSESKNPILLRLRGSEVERAMSPCPLTLPPSLYTQESSTQSVAALFITFVYSAGVWGLAVKLFIARWLAPILTIPRAIVFIRGRRFCSVPYRDAVGTRGEHGL